MNFKPGKKTHKKQNVYIEKCKQFGYSLESIQDTFKHRKTNHIFASLFLLIKNDLLIID
jgi:hypothetical protein